MKQVILINGVPASGKSTVAAHLVSALSAAGTVPVPFAIDTVKEALFAEIGTGDREYNRMLGRASYHAIFASIAEFPDQVLPIVDAWHGFQPREVLEQHLMRAGIQQVVEVWVSVSPKTAAARYRERSKTRHAGHLPASYAEELYELAGRARPMEVGEIVSVDSEAKMPADLADRILNSLKR